MVLRWVVFPGDPLGSVRLEVKYYTSELILCFLLSQHIVALQSTLGHARIILWGNRGFAGSSEFAKVTAAALGRGRSSSSSLSTRPVPHPDRAMAFVGAVGRWR